jgi:hypothetical protein
MKESFKKGFLNTVISMSGIYFWHRKIFTLPIPSIAKCIMNYAFIALEIPLGTLSSIKALVLNRRLASANLGGGTKRYNIVIVAIAKNESEYIREWIAFHKLIGIDKIFLYDNDSDDGMIDTIVDYIDSGFVEVIHISGNKQQFNAYNDAIKRFRRDCRYMAFIDCDEYLLPSERGCDIAELLDSFVKDKFYAGGVAVNWRMFGSSGYEKKPEGLCIEKFIWRSNIKTGPGNRCIKTIVRSDAVKRFSHAHFPIYKYGYCNVNQYGVPVPGYMNEPEEQDQLIINHYFTKSKEQWIKRRSLGKADTKGLRTIAEFETHDINEELDMSAASYADEVKKLMQSQRH